MTLLFLITIVSFLARKTVILIILWYFSYWWCKVWI